jgi:hypothetical protein
LFLSQKTAENEREYNFLDEQKGPFLAVKSMIFCSLFALRNIEISVSVITFTLRLILQIIMLIKVGILIAIGGSEEDMYIIAK